jgi:hypothetical protein
LLVAACSTTRVVPEGSYRLVDNTVNVVNKGDYPKYQSSDIDKYIRQKPNSYFFGKWNPFIYVYNWSNGKVGGWDRFVQKLGQAPVIFDPTHVESSISNMETHLNYLGYYHSDVTDSLIVYTERINSLTQSYIDGEVHSIIASDTLSRKTTYLWYVDSYKPEYMNVSSQIIKYMTGSETTLGPDVNRLSHTARRAVTPVFLSLVVMIIVVLMFYYFIHHYLIKPIVRINDDLGDFLRYRTNFDSNIACRDEIATLRDRIIILIQKLRQ